ncbi:MAG: LCP family protein [Actinobacteria bacterium]|nr:LCP family protein [Actinomycetota bacterium]
MKRLDDSGGPRRRPRSRPAEPGVPLEQVEPTVYRRKRRRWPKILLLSVIVLLLVFIGLGIWGYAWMKSKESRMREAGVAEALDPVRPGQPVTTLIMGVDKGSVPGETGNYRTDIMMLVSVKPGEKKSAVISIPRDTMITIPGHGTQKINAANAFGGPPLAIETVRRFTGLDVNHYVLMDFEGFKGIVDAVGGVKMHVDAEIHDQYAGDVPAGDQVLDGNTALAFVRARHDPDSVPEGDLSRVENQRKFFQAMLSTVSHVRNPFKLMKVVDVASKNIKTDLTFLQMLSLGRKLQGAGDQMQMATVPGTPKYTKGGWYYIVDEDAFRQMLETFMSSQEVPSQPEAESESSSDQRAGIKVAVLNGTDVTGLAAKVAAELGKAGYGGVNTGNAEDAYSRTTVYYAPGESSKAGLVASDLEGAREPVIEEGAGVTSDHDATVVVVLGSDYRH